MDWFMLVMSVVLFGLGAAAVVYSWRYSSVHHEKAKREGVSSPGTSDSILGAVFELILVFFFDLLLRFLPLWMVKLFIFLAGAGFIYLAYLAFLEV
ncbi:hypothetical protein ACFFJY_01240 [Fictibacillus aquaticus]|uniref:Uncharacterized protein n=1 Tax=Fictibacillus aquaticus TaxID=2021314 RepID=A0A235F7Y2_9BACL|nr:hypothetical protein [Fictibacillus aquaticus]OYD57342.1 hypothetical protein CGZ90_11715 [Fictibacillus aquaticus]